ncbi:hypothetical protein C8Q74DRAFT_1452279 [Fomes fomentarius]|nr:hypothetical protein C8Q74DRAFT_1452279 [Fomes fomentarius]
MPFPPHVVARLSNLQSLEIGRPDFLWPMPPAALDFAKLFAAACPSLQELSLTHLHFNSFADFLDVLWSFPHIRKVSVSYLYWPVSTNDVTTFPTTPRRFNNLTTVLMRGGTSNMDMFADVWGANVKTLTLRAIPFIHDGDSSCFLCLEQLEVDSFLNAVRALKRIRSEHLRIVEVHQTVKAGNYERLLAGLSEINGIFSQPMFGSLRRIALTIVYRYYKRQDEVRWVEDVTACFPGLQNRGILHVSVRCGY